MTRSGRAFSCVLVKQPRGYTALCLNLDVAVELYLDSAIEGNLPYMRPVPEDADPRRTAPDSVVERFDLRAPSAPSTRAKPS